MATPNPTERRALTASERSALETAALTRRAGGALSEALELGGYGLASGTAQLADYANAIVGRVGNYGENVVRGLVGADTVAYDPYQYQRMVDSWGAPQAAIDRGWVGFPDAAAPAPAVVVPTTPGTPGVGANRGYRDTSIALPSVAQQTQNLGEWRMVPEYQPEAAAPQYTSVSNGVAGPVVSTTPASPVMAASSAAVGIAPTQAARVEAQTAERLNPIRCTSGVCRPTMQVGDYYANARQSGIAREGGFGNSMADRFGLAAAEASLLAGGRAGLALRDRAARADDVGQLRQTPQYLAEFNAALVNAGGNRAAAQSIADQRFLAAVTDPNLALGLVENDTSAAMDVALAQQAAASLESGQTMLPNRLSTSIADSGYYGAGILPYGAGPGQPGFLVPGAGGPVPVSGFEDVAEVYSAPSRALGGAAATQARADAGEAAIQRLLTAGSNAGATQALRIAQLQAQATGNDPAVQYVEQLRQAQARALGNPRGNSANADVNAALGLPTP